MIGGRGCSGHAPIEPHPGVDLAPTSVSIPRPPDRGGSGGPDGS
ncbi:hypothetical protein FM106_02585 [Brachybacterium faecium]|nr:hypothetical protein FM106_02585 [Brachybacterium faecium]